MLTVWTVHASIPPPLYAWTLLITEVKDNFAAATANSVSSDMPASSLICYSGLRYIKKFYSGFHGHTVSKHCSGIWFHCVILVFYSKSANREYNHVSLAPPNPRKVSCFTESGSPHCLILMKSRYDW
jgi:hypothetical protein